MSFSSGATHMLIQSGVTVYDKETNSVREIRYCENENSIFKDDQSSNSVKTPIVFRMGRLFVGEDRPNLMAYLDAHPGNKVNGGKMFELVDNERDAKEVIEKEFLVNDAIALLRQKTLDELLPVAISFGIDINKQSSEIKHDLLFIAKSSPSTFISSFDNPMVAMKSKIKQADMYQVIKLDKDYVRWFDTDKVIVSVPAGQDPLDIMVRFCMTEGGAPVAAEIERQLSMSSK
jgi:hypothetical protein